MQTIDAETLPGELQQLFERAHHGEQFTILHHHRPICQIVPIARSERELGRLEDDPLYGAPALGRTTDGKTAADHDAILYGAVP
jgi:antitoxin (DNA-binding transcriptional repressor) of toxin-antitoxin stability system